MHPSIEILDKRAAERLSIVSFVVRHGRGYLHHNFVVALLNDLFGIQARGGCSAGPYATATACSTSSATTPSRDRARL